jgi:hypothetical protein
MPKKDLEGREREKGKAERPKSINISILETPSHRYDG